MSSAKWLAPAGAGNRRRVPPCEDSEQFMPADDWAVFACMLDDGFEGEYTSADIMSLEHIIACEHNNDETPFESRDEYLERIYPHHAGKIRSLLQRISPMKQDLGNWLDRSTSLQAERFRRRIVKMVFTKAPEQRFPLPRLVLDMWSPVEPADRMVHKW